MKYSYLNTTGVTCLIVLTEMLLEIGCINRVCALLSCNFRAHLWNVSFFSTLIKPSGFQEGWTKKPHNPGSKQQNTLVLKQTLWSLMHFCWFIWDCHRLHWLSETCSIKRPDAFKFTMLPTLPFFLLLKTKPNQPKPNNKNVWHKGTSIVQDLWML